MDYKRDDLNRASDILEGICTQMHIESGLRHFCEYDTYHQRFVITRRVDANKKVEAFCTVSGVLGINQELLGVHLRKLLSV